MAWQPPSDFELAVGIIGYFETGSGACGAFYLFLGFPKGLQHRQRFSTWSLVLMAAFPFYAYRRLDSGLLVAIVMGLFISLANPSPVWWFC